jgi:DNA-binding Xre family transcriptional regulator
LLVYFDKAIFKGVIMKAGELSGELLKYVERVKMLEDEVARLRLESSAHYTPISSPIKAGEVLRNTRLEQALDQKTVQAMADIGDSTLSVIESGKKSIRLDTLLRVTSALGLDVYIGAKS